MCDSPQSLPYNKGPSNSAEWRGWFSGLVVRHLSGNQETRVRFPAEHIFTHFFVVSISVPIIHYYLIYVRNHCESPSEGNRLVIQRLMRQLVVIISLLILYTINIYIYIYIVSKVGGRDYEQLIASFHLGSPPYSPFGAVIQQGFLRK